MTTTEAKLACYAELFLCTDECVIRRMVVRQLPRELTQHAYPGQPATRTRPPTKPCTCEYRLRRNEVAPLHGPYVKCDDFTSRLFHDCWWRWSFRINPTCPHHAPQPSIEALWNDPALNVMRDPYDLDDNERTDR